MQTITKSREGVYIKFQPGDGTIYTAFHVYEPDSDPDNMYVAIGSGDEIEGGYFMRRSSLRELAKRLMESNENESLIKFLQGDHFVRYWLSHFKGRDWTGTVAILFGMVLTVSTEDLGESLKIIGDIYRNNHEDVYGDLLHWTQQSEEKNNVNA